MSKVAIGTMSSPIGVATLTRFFQFSSLFLISRAPCRLIDTDISTPCSIWEQYRKSRTSWGINVLGSFLVEIEASDGTVGFATGFGGKYSEKSMPPVCHEE